MFLWGIDGQIWAVRWADFNYKQHPKVVPTRSISETLRTTLLLIRGRRLKLRSLSCLELSSFMQNLECFDGIPWAKTWACGQNRGHRSFR
jgi:hypothetical protein